MFLEGEKACRAYVTPMLRLQIGVKPKPLMRGNLSTMENNKHASVWVCTPWSALVENGALACDYFDQVREARVSTLQTDYLPLQGRWCPSYLFRHACSPSLDHPAPELDQVVDVRFLLDPHPITWEEGSNKKQVPQYVGYFTIRVRNQVSEPWTLWDVLRIHIARDLSSFFTPYPHPPQETIHYHYANNQCLLYDYLETFYQPDDELVRLQAMGTLYEGDKWAPGPLNGVLDKRDVEAAYMQNSGGGYILPKAPFVPNPIIFQELEHIVRTRTIPTANVSKKRAFIIHQGSTPPIQAVKPQVEPLQKNSAQDRKKEILWRFRTHSTLHAVTCSKCGESIVTRFGSSNKKSVCSTCRLVRLAKPSSS